VAPPASSWLAPSSLHPSTDASASADSVENRAVAQQTRAIADITSIVVLVTPKQARKMERGVASRGPSRNRCRWMSFKRPGMVLCCGFALACSDGEGRAEPMTPEGDTGWAALVDWDGVPVLGSHRYSVLASNERHDSMPWPLIEPGNKDFNNFVSVCGDRLEMLFQHSDGASCDQGIEGYVIASASGPGFVSRFHMTSGVIEGTAL